jgi:ATP/maltotriose-dependent transcriptional regulator MalT
VRSAVYRAASPDQRRSVHLALAKATDVDTDPDRHAWHRAHGTAQPDERTAAELERSAERAQARGGLAATAAFLQQAVIHTPDPGRRAQRALAAARATYGAGSPDTALKLLASAEMGPVDDGRLAQIEVLRAQIAYTVGRGSEGARSLLRAARRLESHDLSLAREIYHEAISGPGRGAFLPRAGDGQLELALAARSALPLPSSARPADLLLDGTAIRITEGQAACVPTLKSAMTAFSDQGLSDEEGLRWLWLAGITAVGLWDDDTCALLSARYLELIRRVGQIADLPMALTLRIAYHVLAGELTEVAMLEQELTAVSEVTRIHRPIYGPLLRYAWQGSEGEYAELVRTATEDVVHRGEGMASAMISQTSALLANSLGRYGDALVAARKAIRNRIPGELGAMTWALVECVEAAVRSGDLEAAAGAFEQLVAVTSPSDTDWALGIEARSRALMSAGTNAEGCYREAIDRLGRTRLRGELARAHLLYGEWLRRGRRRQAARDELHIAHDLFSSMGMKAFAERAARELMATGENVRKRIYDTTPDLTAQETLIIRLVREGLTNPEIGTRLYLSPRTVEWHLRKIFGKLGVTSRKQLRNKSNAQDLWITFSGGRAKDVPSRVSDREVTE